MVKSHKLPYWLYALTALGLSGWILIVSLSRMSLAVLAEQSNCEGARNTPIALNTAQDTNESVIYKLPTVSTLSNNPFYGLKLIRDVLWVSFSPSSINKSEISHLIADKRMAEMYALIKIDQTGRALDAAKDGFEWLKKSNEYLKKADPSGRKSSLYLDLSRSGLAYRQMVESLSKMIDLDVEKYSELITNLNSWNENQKADLEKISL